MPRYSDRVDLRQLAQQRQGVSYTTARRWFAAGKLPVPARRAGGLIVVGEPAVRGAGWVGDVREIRTLLCARLHGGRAAASRAKRAIDAVTAGRP
jgi:predicted site-specific integrase-resolvase